MGSSFVGPAFAWENAHLISRRPRLSAEPEIFQERNRMMSWLTMKKLGMATATLFVSAMLVGCEEKGPAQRAGENIDKAGQNLKDSVDPRGPAEKAGDKVDKALRK